MPESFPNQFTVDDIGVISTQFMLLAGTPTADLVINWGKYNPSMNGTPESDNCQVQHGLGVIPKLILLAGICTTPPFRYIPFVRWDIPPTATVFNCFVTDMGGTPAGPGFWGAVFPWVAIG